ncbi:TPA: hypothetical protein P9I14_002611 [Yersinia enterocolitica]|nr:hypothetical protein [Yersinia enterocolitica]HDQ4770682.1 hypothetical protein [Yersinia enterocolitica]
MTNIKVHISGQPSIEFSAEYIASVHKSNNALMIITYLKIPSTQKNAHYFSDSEYKNSFEFVFPDGNENELYFDCLNDGYFVFTSHP